MRIVAMTAIEVPMPYTTMPPVMLARLTPPIVARAGMAPPAAIWRLPMNAEAVPATCDGCEDIAAAPALGKMTPQPNIITLMPAATVTRPSNPNSCTPAIQATPVMEITSPITMRRVDSTRSIIAMLAWLPSRSASVPMPKTAEYVPAVAPISFWEMKLKVETYVNSIEKVRHTDRLGAMKCGSRISGLAWP